MDIGIIKADFNGLSDQKLYDSINSYRKDYPDFIIMTKDENISFIDINDVKYISINIDSNHVSRKEYYEERFEYISKHISDKLDSNGIKYKFIYTVGGNVSKISF